MTVVQGNIINIKADAVVHPTSTSLSMSGEVGLYFVRHFASNGNFSFFRFFRIKLGRALATAGGKKLRDALSHAAKNKSLASVGDGNIL